jgi:hypothetical protein
MKPSDYPVWIAERRAALVLGFVTAGFALTSAYLLLKAASTLDMLFGGGFGLLALGAGYATYKFISSANTLKHD